MKKLHNRYLNLAGAPWSPDRPSSKTMLANYFGIVASAGLIVGAAQINPIVEKYQLACLGSGLLGAGIALSSGRKSRHDEAKKLSTQYEKLLIDTDPNGSTPPTSPEILGRVVEKKSEYLEGDLVSRSLAHVKLNSTLWAINVFTVMHTNSPMLCPMVSLFAGYQLVEACDIAGRYRQLNKVSEMKWTIIDEKDAIHQSKNEKNAQNTVNPSYVMNNI